MRMACRPAPFSVGNSNSAVLWQLHGLRVLKQLTSSLLDMTMHKVKQIDFTYPNLERPTTVDYNGALLSLIAPIQVIGAKQVIPCLCYCITV